MAHIGLLLAQEHYPRVSVHKDEIDAQLRMIFESQISEIERLSVFDLTKGLRPRSAASCDVWVVSGAAACPAIQSRLVEFLRGAAALGVPLLALYHGEHMLHQALAGPGARPPETQILPRCVRNPFRSFWIKDKLFRFDPKLRKVEALDSLQDIAPGRFFEASRCAV